MSKKGGEESQNSPQLLLLAISELTPTPTLYKQENLSSSASRGRMLSSYLQAEQRVRDDYAKTLQAGLVRPASSVVASLNFVLLIGWLFVSPSLSEACFQRSRLPFFLCISYISAWNLLYTRSIGVVGSIGVGLNSALCVVLAVNFILLHDPRTFKRLVLRPVPGPSGTDGRTQLAGRVGTYDGQGPERLLAWEPMPGNLWRRLFWILDLITSLRGVHWSWSSSASPPAIFCLNEACSNRTASAARNVSRFIIDYLLIDLLKCLMIADPYFLGYSTKAPPPHLSAYLTSPWGQYTYRLLLSTAGMYTAVDLEFASAALLQVNVLGPVMLGLNALPLTFPPIWGSPSAILCKGLRGFWGESWHQFFRMHFVSIGDAAADLLLKDERRSPRKYQSPDNKPLDGLKSSKARHVIRTVAVFLFSGLLHACASYTLLGPTKPFATFLFFALQPLGMAIQSACSKLFTSSYLSMLPDRWTTVIRQASNAGFTILWLWGTAGMFFDDMASGGMWLLDPIPVSFIRGLGLSKDDKRFWCW
ncbi:uncharacterized protein Z520_08171 [Fonsecaea multimorphosa CBS 102226]|uniref:Wax synthase domain-containing protein n=1 Tax=Fonsecaea multimorphosa CBS 102226 TaxID=1442371 RepID=A0A0D2IFT2_9EURO|nr:uncharacterized protein Z520_08171 [Fonsecaea multimorphosa CBS 102226]KIX95916.1 hypothetical protein Z520_08171 [Fonsecaea multimorphosa CBS 102226]OAL21688.1 hypothetical protein AYO22_07630 [Fonsecaea multimorphosa]